MRLERERVLLLAWDLVLAAQVLGGLQHPTRDGEVHASRGHPGTREPVVQHHAVASYTPPDRRGVELDLTHALDSPGQQELSRTGLDLHRRVEHSLEARAAATVQLEACHLDGQPCVQGGHPSHRGASPFG